MITYNRGCLYLNGKIWISEYFILYTNLKFTTIDKLSIIVKNKLTIIFSSAGLFICKDVYKESKTKNVVIGRQSVGICVSGHMIGKVRSDWCEISDSVWIARECDYLIFSKQIKDLRNE